MDMEKLKQWLDIAQNMHGGDFWKNIFDQEFAKQFINDSPHYSPYSTAGSQPTREDERNTRTFPIIDIFEGEEEVMIIVELPGVKKENIELALNGNILMIKGTSMPIHPHLQPKYSERFYGEFQRQIKLNDPVNPGELNAKFWNGLLLVSYRRIIEKGEMIPIE